MVLGEQQKFCRRDKAEIRKFGIEVIKGVWWMPRQKATMKDAAGCDKPR